MVVFAAGDSIETYNCRPNSNVKHNDFFWRLRISFVRCTTKKIRVNTRRSAGKKRMKRKMTEHCKEQHNLMKKSNKLNGIKNVINTHRKIHFKSVHK